MQSSTSNPLEKLVSKAGTAYSEGSFTEALNCYEEALQLQPANAVLYANISAIQLRLEQPAQALAHAETAVTLSPHWAKAHYRKGEALKKLGENVAAILSLSYAARLDPSHKNTLDSLIHLAITYFDSFPIQQLTALRLQDDRFTILCAIGQKFLEIDANREAVEVLTHGLALQSDSLKLRESAVSALALAYCRLKQYPEAIRHYLEELRICEELGGRTLEVHDRIAVAAEMAGQWKMAEKHRRIRIEQLRGRELAVEGMKFAEVLLQQRQTDEAIALLTDVDEDRMTRDEKACRRRTLGLALCHKADYSRALHFLEKVPLQGVDGAATAEAIAKCYSMQGKTQQTSEYLDRIIDAAEKTGDTPLCSRLNCLLCRLLLASDQTAAALQVCGRILRMTRGNKSLREDELEGLRLMARICEREGDAQSAISLVLRCLSRKDLNSEQRINLLVQLSQLKEKLDDQPEDSIQEAIQLARTMKRDEMLLRCLSAAIRQAVRRGEARKAEQWLAEEKVLGERTSDSDLRSLILEDSSLLEGCCSSDGEHGLQTLEEALAEAQEANNPEREMSLLDKLAKLMEEKGRYAEAEAYFAAELTVGKQLRAARPMAEAHAGITRMRMKRNELDSDTALEHAKSALTLYKILNDARGKAEMLLLVSECEGVRENKTLEWATLEKAITIAREEGLQDVLSLAELKRVSLAMDRVEQLSQQKELLDKPYRRRNSGEFAHPLEGCQSDASVLERRRLFSSTRFQKSDV